MDLNEVYISFYLSVLLYNEQFFEKINTIQLELHLKYGLYRTGGNATEFVGLVALTAATTKNFIFWDIMLCSLVKVNRHFRGTHHFHLQG
jgi:hypothetical protein